MSIKKHLDDLSEWGYTQDEIAEGSGVSQASISRILNNKFTDSLQSTVEAIETYYSQESEKRAQAAQAAL